MSERSRRKFRHYFGVGLCWMAFTSGIHELADRTWLVKRLETVAERGGLHRGRGAAGRALLRFAYLEPAHRFARRAGLRASGQLARVSMGWNVRQLRALFRRHCDP